MLVACLQYKSLENENETLKRILPLIENAACRKVDLITLPECVTFIRSNSSETLNAAQTEEKSQSLKEFKNAAKKI